MAQTRKNRSSRNRKTNRRNRKNRSSTRRRAYGGFPGFKKHTVNSVNSENNAARAALNRLNGRYVVTRAFGNNNVEANFIKSKEYLSTINKANTVEQRKQQLRHAQATARVPTVKSTVNPALLSSLAGFKRY
jgi:hypothetical protein